MYFYVDESGHTGPELFDETQPMLYYGVLSSSFNVDLLAESAMALMRKKLGVERLHASELGNGRLVLIIDQLCGLQKRLDLRFDLCRVAKPDHAVISFFDQVFDQGVNPAVTWMGYWSPLRYVLLLKVAFLFDEEIAKAAWQARICMKDAEAQAGLIRVCRTLRERVPELPDARSRQLIGEALLWAEHNASSISYNVTDKKALLQIAPNMIGFQSVMHGIAARVKKAKRNASRIVVDQQSQFNKSQKSLAEFYASARGVALESGPGMPKMDLKHIPQVPIQFASSKNSAGLELVDVHLWIFKRVLEGKEVAPELYALLKPQLLRSQTNEVSLNALAKRWTKYFNEIPELKDMPAERVARAEQIHAIDEERRLKAIQALQQHAASALR